MALPHLAVDSTLWVGVRFTSTSAGLIINSVPSVGRSHDLYLENGNFYWFNGDPKANFGLRLMGTATALAVGRDPSPRGVVLAAPRPCPFRDGTAFDFSTPRRGGVRLEVLDVSGRRVRSLVNEVREAGRSTERWSGIDDEGRPVKPGLYLVRLESAGTVATRRVVFTP
jgi:hypothetical protein